MNEADSEKIGLWYENKGWQKADNLEVADEIIINTCSVRESAEHRVLGLINNLAKLKIENYKLKIVVTGCMLYHGITILKKKLPLIDEFKPIKDFNIPQNFKFHPPNRRANFKFVSIMEGCNNFCTYCVVPFSRGKQQSRSFEEIICEVKQLVKNGLKEIILLGQNVNSYGKDIGDKTTFAQLLTALHKIDGLEKISFLTSNPWDLTDEIIEAMKLPKIDRYLHLPVQSGDDEILRRMNRHYTVEHYLSLIGKIKQAIPDIKIGTDIIVGFPGETEKQFQNTVDLCKKAGFVKVYLGRYSKRPKTSAFKLKDDVSSLEKKRRWKILDNLINSKIKQPD